MANTEQVFFPKSYIAMGSGDLGQVTDFNARTNNGAKQVHTLRNPQGGITFGPGESAVSANFVIGEDGLERDYVRMVEKRQLKQLRVKIPHGEVWTYNGAFQEVQINGSIDDATKGSFTFVGKKVPN